MVIVLVFMLLYVKFVIVSMLAKPKIIFQHGGVPTGCTWAKFTLKKNSTALLHHFAHNHPDIFYSKPDLSSCYSVVFVEQPTIFRLNFCEAK